MKTISLPRSPFFLSSDGRYLPSLTELIVEAVAMQQRLEIEEELFKLRLKRRCGAAARGDARPTDMAAVIDSPRHSIKIFPGGSVDGFHIQPESPSALPLSMPSPTTGRVNAITTLQNDRAAKVFDPNNPYPKGRW